MAQWEHNGLATAEVGAADRKRLADTAARMDRVLDLWQSILQNDLNQGASHNEDTKDSRLHGHFRRGHRALRRAGRAANR